MNMSRKNKKSITKEEKDDLVFIFVLGFIVGAIILWFYVIAFKTLAVYII